MVITANEAGHIGRACTAPKTRTLHTLHDHCLRPSRCVCAHPAQIVGYSLPTHLYLTGTHAVMASRAALRRFCHPALMPSCRSHRISRICPYSPDQLLTDSILSCNRDRIARLSWYGTMVPYAKVTRWLLQRHTAASGCAHTSHLCSLYPTQHVQLAA